MKNLAPNGGAHAGRYSEADHKGCGKRHGDGQPRDPTPEGVQDGDGDVHCRGQRGSGAERSARGELPQAKHWTLTRPMAGHTALARQVQAGAHTGAEGPTANGRARIVPWPTHARGRGSHCRGHDGGRRLAMGDRRSPRYVPRQAPGDFQTGVLSMCALAGMEAAGSQATNRTRKRRQQEPGQGSQNEGDRQEVGNGARENLRGNFR